MKIAELLNNKVLKSKAKTETLSGWLLDNIIGTDELIAFAKSANDSVKQLVLKHWNLPQSKTLLLLIKRAFCL